MSDCLTQTCSLFLKSKQRMQRLSTNHQPHRLSNLWMLTSAKRITFSYQIVDVLRLCEDSVLPAANIWIVVSVDSQINKLEAYRKLRPLLEKLEFRVSPHSPPWVWALLSRGGTLCPEFVYYLVAALLLRQTLFLTYKLCLYLYGTLEFTWVHKD